MATPTPSHHWFRLTIDTDQSGGPIGVSYEVHHGRLHVATHVLAVPSPFDTAAECLEALCADLLDRYGVWAELPLG